MIPLRIGEEVETLEEGKGVVLVEVVNQETKGRVDSWNKEVMKSAQGDILVEEEDLKQTEEEEKEGEASTLPP